MSKASKYNEQADKLAKAVDIAEQIIVDSREFVEELKKAMLAFGADVKQSAISPEPQFKNLTSLKYLERDFFTFWNESSLPDVDRFWDRIFESKLGYVRKDTIHDVLKRKKIKSIHELDVVIDNMVVYEQCGRLSREQVIELSNYIGEFEKRKSKSKK